MRAADRAGTRSHWGAALLMSLLGIVVFGGLWAFALQAFGDNRDNSNDSRYWGAVPLENLTGFVRGIWRSGGPSGSTARRFGSID